MRRKLEAFANDLLKRLLRIVEVGGALRQVVAIRERRAQVQSVPESLDGRPRFADGTERIDRAIKRITVAVHVKAVERDDAESVETLWEVAGIRLSRRYRTHGESHVRPGDREFLLLQGFTVLLPSEHHLVLVEHKCERAGISRPRLCARSALQRLRQEIQRACEILLVFLHPKALSEGASQIVEHPAKVRPVWGAELESPSRRSILLVAVRECTTDAETFQQQLA